MRLRHDSVQSLQQLLALLGSTSPEDIGDFGVDRGTTRVTKRVCKSTRDEVVPKCLGGLEMRSSKVPLMGFSAVGHNNLGKVLHATAQYFGTSTRQEPGYILGPVFML
jgi:hypothetical protein